MVAGESRRFSLAAKIINGSIAGLIGTVVVYPIDFVKIRFQAQDVMREGLKTCESIPDCFRKTYSTYGIFGLYRGSAVVFIFITPEKAVKLAGNDFFREHLKDENNELSLPRQVLAGALAGFLQNLITNPMDLLKIRVQTSMERGGATAAQIAKGLWRAHGIKGMYRGVGLTWARDISWSCIYFPLFAAFHDLGPRRNDGSGEAVFWISFLSGVAASGISSFVVTPIDVVKTRTQALRGKDFRRSYASIGNVFIKIYREEGPRAFFKGGLCRLMVIMPLFGTIQTFYYIGLGEKILGLKYYRVG